MKNFTELNKDYEKVQDNIFQTREEKKEYENWLNELDEQEKQPEKINKE